MVRLECSGYAALDNFAIELREDGGGTLKIWDWPGARVGDDGGCVVTVEESVVSEWCNRIRRVRMLAVSRTEMITDTRTYAVTVIDGATCARYSWPAPAPRGWRGLGRIVKQIEKTARTDDA